MLILNELWTQSLVCSDKVMYNLVKLLHLCDNNLYDLLYMT